MIRIRFFRAGRKRKPFYKIVVTDKDKPPKSGRFVEELGFYDPVTKDCKIEKERVKHWIGEGASPSDTVYNLLVRKGIIIGKKIPVHSVSKKEEASEKIEAPVKEEPVNEVETKEEVTQEDKKEPLKEENLVKKEEKTEEPVEDKAESQEVSEPEGEQDIKEKTEE